MKAQVFSVTKCVVEGMEGITPEQILVYEARVSSDRENKLGEPERLIKYLLTHSHWSPFDMVDITVQCDEVPLDVVQQLLRHWSFKFQQFSMRYAVCGELPEVELRAKNVSNRQSSSNVIADMALNEIVYEALESSVGAYETLVYSGVAPETARRVLPVSTPTSIFVKGSLRTWMTYLWQRDSEHAQLEHQELARAIKGELRKYAPLTMQLVDEYEPRIVKRNSFYVEALTIEWRKCASSSYAMRDGAVLYGFHLGHCKFFIRESELNPHVFYLLKFDSESTISGGSLDVCKRYAELHYSAITAINKQMESFNG